MLGMNTQAIGFIFGKPNFGNSEKGMEALMSQVFHVLIDFLFLLMIPLCNLVYIFLRLEYSSHMSNY